MPQGSRRLHLMFFSEIMPRGQIFRRLKALSLLLCILPWTEGCQKKHGVSPDEMAWDDSLLTVEHENASPALAQLREQGFPDLDPLPRRFLSFRGGAIKLLEYAEDAEAYFA